MCGAVCSAELHTTRATNHHGMEDDSPQSPRKNDSADEAEFGTPSGTHGPPESSGTRQRTESESATGAEAQSKRLRTEARDVPSSSFVVATSPGLAPSPPQFVSLAEVMSATDGMKNMMLAHEIALDSEFELKQPAPAPEGSMFARVHEMMHKVFWDLLASELAEDPPCYNHAMTLLREIKETLLDMVPERAVSLRTDIEQRLDIDLIKQQAEAGTLDFQQYAQYVIYTMGRMCCPVRDDDVQALAELKEVVPTFKGILEVLKKMKLDYANFTIRQARPVIIANSITYEKKKFTEFLATQKDGLEATRKWLLNHKEQVLAAEPSEGEPRSPNQLLTTILAKAYVESLEWPEDQLLPETLVLDRERMQRLSERLQQLVVLATVILVTLPVVGQSVRDLAEFKKHLKDRIKLLLEEANTTSDEGLAQVLPNVAAQVEREVEEVLRKHGLSELTADTRAMLKGQIEAVAKSDNRIRQLARSRLMAFMTDVASSTATKSLQVPVGFSSVSVELGALAGQFNNLVWYNRCVFGEWYSDILNLQPSSTTTTMTSTNNGT